MDWLQKLDTEDLKNIAASWNGEDEYFLWDGEKLHHDIAHMAEELIDKREHEIGDNVKIHYKEMLIPAKVTDKREIFGRTEYRLALLEDDTEVSSWMTDKHIENYESTR